MRLNGMLRAWPTWGLLAMTAAFAQDPGVAPPGPIKRVAVNGTELAYVEQGQGSPVILVLGAVGDYRVWTHQVAAFSTRHRVIAYSFRYHHPNAPPSSGAADYTLPTHAEDLAMLIRSLGLGPTHLVGYSYGGSVAALVGRNHPELVRSLVLAEPPLYSLLSQHPEAKSLLARDGPWRWARSRMHSRAATTLRPSADSSTSPWRRTASVACPQRPRP